MPTTRRTVLALTLGVATLSAFNYPSCADEAVTVVGNAWPGHAPMWMAVEKGFFKKAGFDATFSFVGGSADRVSVISSGEVAFGGMGAAAVVPAMGRGNKNFYWIGSPDVAARDFSGIVGRAEIKTLKDLKGKKLAFQFGASEEVTDYFLLQKVGLDLFKDVTLVNLPQANMVQALKQGDIDAAGAWSPEFEIMQKMPGMHTLADVGELGYLEKYNQMPVPDVLLMNAKWVDANPERAKKFMAAYFEGVDYVRANPEETAKTAPKYTKQTPEIFTLAASKLTWLTKADQCKQLSNQGVYPVMDNLVDFMVMVKRVDQKFDPRGWARADVVGCK